MIRWKRYNFYVQEKALYSINQHQAFNERCNHRRTIIVVCCWNLAVKVHWKSKQEAIQGSSFVSLTAKQARNSPTMFIHYGKNHKLITILTRSGYVHLLRRGADPDIRIHLNAYPRGVVHSSRKCISSSYWM